MQLSSCAPLWLSQTWCQNDDVSHSPMTPLATDDVSMHLSHRSIGASHAFECSFASITGMPEDCEKKTHNRLNQSISKLEQAVFHKDNNKLEDCLVKKGFAMKHCNSMLLYCGEKRTNPAVYSLSRECAKTFNLPCTRLWRTSWWGSMTGGELVQLLIALQVRVSPVPPTPVSVCN